MRFYTYATISFAILLGLVPATLAAQSGLDLMDVDLVFVGAHPDDDTGVLATFARYLLDEGFEGTVITATGGDGGGNAIGPEAGRALALIRKEEERRALEAVGVDSPSFLGLVDFYFTLSADETSRKWGESFLCDVVRHVRLQRPEVIVTMWPGPGTHGQHQMAARAATIAFEKAGEPGYCPDQIESEFLAPFTPSKLYYRHNGDDPDVMVEIPSDDYSPSRYMRYADIRAYATAFYRSQGFDRFARIPVEQAQPERFMLVRSRVPLAAPETHLLEGARLAAGSSPPGVRLAIEPERFSTGVGQPLPVSVHFDGGENALTRIEVTLEAPNDWRSETVETVKGNGKAHFRVTPGPGVALDENVRLRAHYRAELDGRPVEGSNYTWVQARAPVGASFVPLYDVAGYQQFARETKTEWVIESLPTRVPLALGRTTPVRIRVSNRTEERARGRLELDLPEGIEVEGDTAYDVAAGEESQLTVGLSVDARVLPEGRQSTKLPIKVRAGATQTFDTGDAYVLPTLAIPRIATPPAIDGDLDDMRSWPGGEISPEDRWWRRPPENAADSSARFHLAYDADFLYAGVEVSDQTVVCNIAPDDIKAQLRSDAVGITVDPSGASEDTSTVLQAAAFPCTTAGFGARGFRDADADQGLMEETAPGMEVASSRTEGGYTLEARIPWSAMPERPSPGDEIAVNVVIYDGDDAEARVGANISESGLAWAAFEWGGKQALPYLWPRVVLER